MFKQRNFVLTSAALATSFVLAATIAATATTPAAKSPASVAISADRPMISKSYVEREIVRQAKAQGIKLSPGEARSAAVQAMNDLAAKEKGPQKLIILLKFKKFTICISTGRDKGFCKGGGGSTAKK